MGNDFAFFCDLLEIIYKITFSKMGFLVQISYNVKNLFGVVDKSLFAQISVLDLLFYLKHLYLVYSLSILLIILYSVPILIY